MQIFVYTISSKISQLINRFSVFFKVRLFFYFLSCNWDVQAPLQSSLRVALIFSCSLGAFLSRMPQLERHRPAVHSTPMPTYTPSYRPAPVSTGRRMSLPSTPTKVERVSLQWRSAHQPLTSHTDMQLASSSFRLLLSRLFCVSLVLIVFLYPPPGFLRFIFVILYFWTPYQWWSL